MSDLTNRDRAYLDMTIRNNYLKRFEFSGHDNNRTGVKTTVYEVYEVGGRDSDYSCSGHHHKHDKLSDYEKGVLVINELARGLFAGTMEIIKASYGIQDSPSTGNTGSKADSTAQTTTTTTNQPTTISSRIEELNKKLDALNNKTTTSSSATTTQSSDESMNIGLKDLEEAVTEKPKAEQPAAAPTTEKPKAEQPATTPTTEQPKAEQPAAAPAVEQPKTEAATKPATEQVKTQSEIEKKWGKVDIDFDDSYCYVYEKAVERNSQDLISKYQEKLLVAQAQANKGLEELNGYKKAGNLSENDKKIVEKAISELETIKQKADKALTENVVQEKDNTIAEKWSKVDIGFNQADCDAWLEAFLSDDMVNDIKYHTRIINVLNKAEAGIKELDEYQKSGELSASDQIIVNNALKELTSVRDKIIETLEGSTIDGAYEKAKEADNVFDKTKNLEDQRDAIKKYNNYAKAVLSPVNLATNRQIRDCINSMTYIISNNKSPKVKDLTDESTQLLIKLNEYYNDSTAYRRE